MEEKYEEYKDSLVYNIKKKCGVKIDNAASDFKVKIKEQFRKQYSRQSIF
jgi:hypothetical protein